MLSGLALVLWSASAMYEKVCVGDSSLPKRDRQACCCYVLLTWRADDVRDLLPLAIFRFLSFFGPNLHAGPRTVVFGSPRGAPAHWTHALRHSICQCFVELHCRKVCSPPMIGLVTSAILNLVRSTFIASRMRTCVLSMCPILLQVADTASVWGPCTSLDPGAPPNTTSSPPSPLHPSSLQLPSPPSL